MYLVTGVRERRELDLELPYTVWDTDTGKFEYISGVDLYDAYMLGVRPANLAMNETRSGVRFIYTDCAFPSGEIIQCRQMGGILYRSEDNKKFFVYWGGTLFRLPVRQVGLFAPQGYGALVMKDTELDKSYNWIHRTIVFAPENQDEDLVTANGVVFHGKRMPYDDAVRMIMMELM